jgi:hypothetical protein
VVLSELFFVYVFCITNTEINSVLLHKSLNRYSTGLLHVCNSITIA